MHPLPHNYAVSATAEADTNVTLSSPGLAPMTSAGPAEFDGPGDQWSPESLLVASVADCFILTFRAVARASRFEWSNLDCHVDGLLDRVDGELRFIGFDVRATLTVPADANVTKAEKLLQKSEGGCLITNSLIAECHLKTEVVISG